MFIVFTESHLHHLSFTTQMWSDVNAYYIIMKVMINVCKLECRVIKCQLTCINLTNIFISNSMFLIIKLGCHSSFTPHNWHVSITAGIFCYFQLNKERPCPLSKLLKCLHDDVLYCMLYSEYIYIRPTNHQQLSIAVNMSGCKHTKLR